jgi:hypothetical protein
LRDATPEQRKGWRLIGRGDGLHWAELDEDISVNGLLGLPTRGLGAPKLRGKGLDEKRFAATALMLCLEASPEDTAMRGIETGWGALHAANRTSIRPNTP